MALEKQDYASEVTGLSTELNSAADGDLDIGSARDNTGNHAYCDVELDFASLDLSAQTDPNYKIWFIRSIDGGSAYEDGSASVEPARSPDVIIPLREVSAAQTVIIAGVPLPNEYYKVLGKNDTGQALAASGNTIMIHPWTYDMT